MRLIRTEMYFDEEQVNGYDPYRKIRRYPGEFVKNPGLAFLWCKGEVGSFLDFSSIKAFEPLGRSQRSGSGTISRDQLNGVIDLFLRGVDHSDFPRIPESSQLQNREIVEYIFEQQIVMEHSPPFSISFKAILDAKNSPMWIGTFVGGGAAWDHPVLLLLTVPSGIIVVSSAMGIANAMQGGLNKIIKRVFDGGKS